MARPTAPATHGYIYEVDLMRALTAFTVVSIHTLSNTNFLLTTPASLIFATLVGHALHYNRELFMFISALVLTYVYWPKPMVVRSFWLKRVLVVFIPYVLWTIIYVLYNNRGQSLGTYVGLSASSIVTGNASAQLYYILLTLQFYAAFPAFLWWLKRVAGHPWRVLSISLAVQLALVGIDFAFIQSGPLSGTAVANFLDQFQNRFFLLYEFFFVLGGITAVYLDTIRSFLLRHGKAIVLTMLLTIAAYSAYYYVAIGWLQQSLSLASTVVQPSVVLYSAVVIGFIGWLAIHWARRRAAYPFVKALAEISFGIYFIHLLMLNIIMRHAFSLLPAGLPVAVKDAAVIVVTFGSSAAICYAIYRLPLLSWTIGRVRSIRWPRPQPKAAKNPV